MEGEIIPSPTFYVDGLILENTFTSISQMVDHVFYLVSFFKRLILRIGWETCELVPHLEMPILFVTGDQDEIVPHEQTLDLYELA